MLFAAGPIYSSAAALAGLRRTLADSPPAETTVQVALYGTPAEVSAVDRDVQSDLQAALAPLAASIARDGRGSATLAIPAAADSTQDDHAVLGFLDELPAHARLVDGAWPAASASAAEPLQVVLLDAAASALQMSVGEQLDLSAPGIDGPTAVPVQLVGVFAIDDPADPYWYADEQLTTGVVMGGGDRVIGPFLTAPEGVLGNPSLTSIHMRWRALPSFGGLNVDNVAGIRGRLEALPNRLRGTTGDSAGVATGLPAILGGAESALLASRTQTLLIMAQLAIMAAYAIVLTASLLVDHRRVETALLRSRGAGPSSIAWLALAEGLILVVPAVLMAPWLAVGEASVLNLAGPLAEIGLTIEPTVTADSYLLAAAAGLICLALLVLPAFFAARNFASEERELSRQETRTLGQRIGLDIALLAISAIALWQLRLYGAPLTRTVQGNLGFDPLLVAAPAIGLLAGGILALRVLPLLAATLERWISRGRDVVGSLGSRQLARRPLHYTRTALLLILAVSLGVFALSYAATWSSSQEDQATYQVGADVRAVAINRPGVNQTLPVDYAAIPGVQAAMPVERIAGGASLASGSVDVVLAIDAAAAESIVRFRGDESTQPVDQLMGVLRDGRPAPEIVTLPQDAAYLRIIPELEIRGMLEFPEVYDPAVGPTPVDPATVTDVSVSATAVVRDARGLFYRLESETVPMVDFEAEILVPLAPRPAPDADAARSGTGQLEGPLQLVGLELDVALPVNTMTTDADVGVSNLSAGAASDGPWADLPVDGWAARMAPGQNVLQPVAAADIDGMVIHLDGQRESYLWGGVSGGRMLFVSAAVDALEAVIPVVVNQAFLAATGTAAGDTIDVTLEGDQRRISIAGVVDAFPTTDPAQALLVLDQPTLGLLRFQSTGMNRNVNEWWMAVPAESSEDVAAALRAAPFDSPEVMSAADRTRGLSTDPVALGIIGALLLGFVATGFFALVALVVSATVSARQRRTEFALLRALGLSAGQLSRWLWLENGSLVVVSLLAGTVVGVVMSWIALPFITVTQQATTPVPPVTVHLPWDRILVLDLLVVVALGIAVGVLAVLLRRIGVGSILRMGED